MDPKVIEELKRRDTAFKETKPEPELYNVRDHLKGITRTDPMSPYQAPRSIIAFKDLSELINKKSFSGAYPQSFAPVSEYFRGSGISPYYDPEDFNDFSHGVMTIATMIDLTANGQPWKLDRDQDLLFVDRVVREYYTQLSAESLANNVQIQAYKAKVEIFLKTLDKAISRMKKRNGTWKNEHFFINLLKTMLKGS